MRTGDEAGAGENRPRRRWTLKEIVQGKPIGSPTHPMVVVFPIALYIAALGLDIVSRLGHFPEAPVAATWLIMGGLLASIAVITTGLVDRTTIRKGSKARPAVNRHMSIQLTATAVMIVNLLVRWGSRYDQRAPIGWILLDAAGALLISVGGHFGGELVFRFGMRVGERPD